MSVLKKFNIFAIIISLTLLGIVFTTINSIVNYSYLEIEKDMATQSISRVNHAKNLMLESLDTKLVDWAWWDDTYNYLKDKNTEYQESNLTQVALEGLKLKSMLLFDEQGGLVKGISLNEQGEMVELTPEMIGHFSPGSPLFEISNDEGNKVGLLSDQGDIYAFSIRPVLQGDKSGPRAGYIAFVQSYVWQIEQIEQVLLLDINYEYHEGTIYESESWIDIEDEQIAGHIKLQDYQDKVLGLINFKVRREVSIIGKASLNQMLVFLTVAILVATVLYYLMLRKLVIDKILKLNREVENVSLDMGSRARVEEFAGGDEMTQLTVNINEMLSRLQSTTELSKSGSENVRSYIDVVGVLIVALDQNGEVLLMNKKASEVLGVDQDKSVGMNWFDHFVVDEMKSEMKNVFNQLMRGEVKNVEIVENKIMTPSGIRQISWHNTLLRDDKGAIVATLSAGEDVTERRMQDQAMSEHLREIEKLNDLMVDREVKMAEMKEKLKKV